MSDTALRQAELIVDTIARTAVENETYFCELDAIAGDGDFGYSLARGFEIVISGWDELEYEDAGGLLKKTAIVLTKRIGGTSGPIWGTAFLRASVAAGPKTELSAADVVAMTRAAIEGMKKRGQSDVGDKTLLDAFVPAVDELERVLRDGKSAGEAIRAASVVARQKTEEIKPWVAKRGRASYTGERSCDTYDAGSIAVAMMAEQLAAVWKSSSTVGAP